MLTSIDINIVLAVSLGNGWPLAGQTRSYVYRYLKAAGLADFQCSLFCSSASQTFAEGLGDYYFQGGRNANEGGRSPTLVTC